MLTRDFGFRQWLAILSVVAAGLLAPVMAVGEPVAQTAAKHVYVSVNAGGGVLRSRPHSIHLLSNENVARIHWSRWGSITAKGRGTDYANGPSPGHHSRNPVRIQLSGRKHCDGVLVYTKIRLRFTHGVPYEGQPHLTTYPYGCPR